MSGTNTEERATIPDSRVLFASDKALRVRLGASGRTVWIPKSAIHDDSECFDAKDHAFGKLVLVPWFAEQIGVELD